MRLQEVKSHVKKDEAPSYMVSVHRLLGLWLTYLLINVVPNVSANAITLMMLPLNITATVLLYHAITRVSFGFLACSFLVCFLSNTLDCVDGNIARIKGSTSLRGVFLDRLVHNISHPLAFIVAGFALFVSSGSMIYLISFIVAGIISEFSPIAIAVKDVESLFIRQALFGKTKNYDSKTHKRTINNNLNPVTRNNSILVKIIKTSLSLSTLYLTMCADLLLFRNSYPITLVFCIVYVLGRLYTNKDVAKWEREFTNVLESLDRMGS